MTIDLGGYPAKKCPRVTHNKYSPSAPEPEPVGPDVQLRFDAGRAFERRVTEDLQSRHGPGSTLLVVDLEDERTWDENIATTLTAMDTRVPLIVNGRLPSVNGRSGAPDLLILEGGGYLPADVKNHRTLSRSKASTGVSRSSVQLSSLGDPGNRSTMAGASNKGGSWRDDVMQLAHYTRMLQELGHHAGDADGDNSPLLIGAILGTDDMPDLIGSTTGLTWYDLTAPEELTYSASAAGHRAKRSALERYDHEFAFRIRVAEAAQSGGELVRPYGVSECDECAWQSYCRRVVPSDDASFAIEMGRLSAREWIYLYETAGVSTVSDLAQLDVEEHVQDYVVRAGTSSKTSARLEDAVRRARMIVEARRFEPLHDTWPDVPRADVEIDFDIEWDSDGYIYQWGVRVRDGQDDSTAKYEPVVSFAAMDESLEERLADEFAAQVQREIDRAEAAGLTVTIFHWSNPETNRTRRFQAVAEVLEGRTCDLLAWMKTNFFSPYSFSIKAVAPAFGFHWSVDDPGGLASQQEVAAARTCGPEAEEARQWCLRYNESDVAAQAAVRDGFRRWLAEQA